MLLRTTPRVLLCRVHPRASQAQRRSSWLLGIGVMLAASPAAADNTFSEVAGASGIVYERVPSASFQTWVDFQLGSLQEPLPPGPPSLVSLPVEPRGWPGVAILDYDLDGDLDVLATNGPGGPNGLFQNQLAQTGVADYHDVAADARIDATAMDVNGVCYGDTDNDGDPDVLLLGRDQPNAFYVNEGDGTFTLELGSQLDLDSLSHPSCTMGDVDGDGLLDVFVANSFDFDVGFAAIFVEPWALNQHNQLFLNDGGTGAFVEVSERVEAMQDIPPGHATITWATSMVDVDADGDLDIVFGDDGGGIPTTKADPVGGVDRAFVHVLQNDGDGFFTPHAAFNRPESPGSWMGLGFGDIDHDGLLDLFGSNFGDYGLPMLGVPYALGDQATRSLFNLGDGVFDDPLPDHATVFGWGNAVFDVDNDGDSDMVYHGSIDMVFIAIADNPGVVMLNDGSGNLTTDLSAMGGRHARRNVHGVAIGDLDRDGFVDVVSAANFVIPGFLPIVPGPGVYDDPLDAVAGFTPLFAPSAEDPALFEWTGVNYENGDLSIDRNNGESGHGSVTVRAVGSVGFTPGARAPRDGTGALFSFAPRGSDTVAMMPITAGSSHTSAHAQEAYFGLGTAERGRLEVLWPGGNRNRLYGVWDGENLAIPEVPCGFDGQWNSLGDYLGCVVPALDDLDGAGIIGHTMKIRLLVSSILAYLDQ